MASEAPSDSDIPENSLEEPDMGWERYIGLEDVLNSYDTVVEIYSGSQFFDPGSEALDQSNTEYHGLDQEVLQPGWDYESRSEGLELIRERLDGNSIVLAFGFDGRDLPNYSDISGELDSRGNWWDHPERLHADMLVDDQTYSGALRPPKGSEINPHVLRDGGELRDVLHIHQ